MIQNDTHVREQRLWVVVFQSNEWTYKENTLLAWKHKGRKIQLSTYLPINTNHTTRQKAPNFWESSKHTNIKCFKSTLFLFLIKDTKNCSFVLSSFSTAQIFHFVEVRIYFFLGCWRNCLACWKQVCKSKGKLLVCKKDPRVKLLVCKKDQDKRGVEVKL